MNMFSLLTVATLINMNLLFLPALPSDQVPAPKQSKPIALVGATVHTVSGDVIADGTILFEEGKIKTIGPDPALPENCEQIDVNGKHVYPGLISANTSLGLVEINAVRATRDFAETGDINPNVRAEVSFNPDSELIPVTRANGITVALSVPTSGLISGSSALMMLDGWTWEAMALKTPAGLHVHWPKMLLNRSPAAKKSEQEQLKDRNKQIKRIKQAFVQARAYMKARQADAKQDVPYHDTDLRWEAMIPVLKKDTPVIIHADEIMQIQAAIDWAVAEDVRVIIMGGYDAWRVTDLLKEHDIPVILTGTHRLPMRRWEDYDMPFKVAKKLAEAGVKFCIATQGGPFGTAHERNLPYQAATAAAYGLSKTEALKAVTLYPAEILGVGDRLGSLEVGKDATLIVTDGDPLEITTQVEMEFIQGRQIQLESRHTQLYDKYRKKYEQIGITE